MNVNYYSPTDVYVVFSSMVVREILTNLNLSRSLLLGKKFQTIFHDGFSRKSEI